MILGRMENEEEKSGEKMMFLVVWLRVEKRRDFGGAHKFYLLPLQNTISPNWRENGSEKWTKIFEQNCPHFLLTFFFFLGNFNLAEINVACLPFVFFPFFFWVSLDAGFYFFNYFFIFLI